MYIYSGAWKYRNGPKWAGMDRNGRMEIPEWTYGNTEMDRNGLIEIQEWTGMDIGNTEMDRNGQWKYRNGPI